MSPRPFFLQEIETLTAKYAALNARLAALEAKQAKRPKSGARKPSSAQTKVSEILFRPAYRKTGFSLLETLLATVAVGALTVGAIQVFKPSEFRQPLGKLAAHQEQTVTEYEALGFSAAPAVRLAWETSKPIGIDLMDHLETLTTPPAK